jgi:hypothetical protein
MNTAIEPATTHRRRIRATGGTATRRRLVVPQRAESRLQGTGAQPARPLRALAELANRSVATEARFDADGDVAATIAGSSVLLIQACALLPGLLPCLLLTLPLMLPLVVLGAAAGLLVGLPIGLWRLAARIVAGTDREASSRHQSKSSRVSRRDDTWRYA